MHSKCEFCLIVERFPGAPIESDEEDEGEDSNSHVRFAPDTKEDQGEEETGGADDKKVNNPIFCIG